MSDMNGRDPGAKAPKVTDAEKAVILQNKERDGILTWGKMLELSEGAALSEIEEGREQTVMVGPLAWQLVRKIAQTRLLGPVCADILVVDTIDWMMSMNVAANEIMVVPTSEIRKVLPIVLHNVILDEPGQS